MKQQFSEVIKVYNGGFVNLSFHIDRMNRTTLFFFKAPCVINLKEDDIPMEYRTGIVKCRIVYSDQIIEVKYEQYQFRQMNNLKLVYSDSVDYSFKFADRRYLNALLSQKNECDEILIVKNGYITDTSFSNVIFENESGLFTPSTYLLAGTKRQILLQQGIIKEAEIKVQDINLYARLYIINAMIDLDDKLCIETASIK